MKIRRLLKHCLKYTFWKFKTHVDYKYARLPPFPPLSSLAHLAAASQFPKIAMVMAHAKPGKKRRSSNTATTLKGGLEPGSKLQEKDVFVFHTIEDGKVYIHPRSINWSLGDMWMPHQWIVYSLKVRGCWNWTTQCVRGGGWCSICSFSFVRVHLCWMVSVQLVFAVLVRACFSSSWLLWIVVGLPRPCRSIDKG